MSVSGRSQRSSLPRRKYKLWKNYLVRLYTTAKADGPARHPVMDGSGKMRGQLAYDEHGMLVTSTYRWAYSSEMGQARVDCQGKGDDERPIFFVIRTPRPFFSR